MITLVIARRSPKRSYSYVNGLRVTEWVQLWRTVDVLQQHYKIWNIVQRVYAENDAVVWKFVMSDERLGFESVSAGGSRGFRPPTAHYSVAFFDDQFLIGCLLSDVVDPARGPAHDNGLDLRGCSQAEVQTRVAGRLETAVGPDLRALLNAHRP